MRFGQFPANFGRFLTKPGQILTNSPTTFGQFLTNVPMSLAVVWPALANGDDDQLPAARAVLVNLQPRG
jgi:hypothetical protein